MLNRRISLLILAMAVACAAVAQSDEPQIKVTPTGRIFIDGALYAGQGHEMFDNGVAVPDVRMGVKAVYGRWNAKIDIGYAMQKLGLKDIYIQYNPNPRYFLRIGNFVHQYGLQSATSSSMKASFDEPLSNTVFNASRQLGIMGEYNAPRYLATFSAHGEPNSIKKTPDELDREGYGFITRQVWRPVITDDGTFFQLGISGAFTTPQSHDDEMPQAGFTMAGIFPTRVVKVVAAEAELTHTRYMWKFTPELLLARGPVAIEAQYFYNRVNMKENMHNFTGQGGYVQVRGLVRGDHYRYAWADGGIAAPAAGSLEITGMYNYTCLNDRHAQQLGEDGSIVTGVYGGRVNTISATATYYVNKYILLRLNYVYAHRWGATSLPTTTINIFQTRLQIVF
ncbi:MAG: ATPase [Bacteroidales bacterium]|nr:ATPase [Bacteroidales bacterium]